MQTSNMEKIVQPQTIVETQLTGLSEDGANNDMDFEINNEVDNQCDAKPAAVAKTQKTHH